MDLHTSRIFDQNTFYQALLKDMAYENDMVLIESPFMTIRRFRELVPVINRLLRRGVQIVVNTKPYDELDEYLYQQSLWVVQQMQSMGIKVYFTVGHHRKIAIIDKRILWKGSLNILSQYDSCEFMRRIDSVEITSQTILQLHLDRFYKVK